MTVFFRSGLALVLMWFFTAAASAADGSGSGEAPLIRPADDTDLSEFVWEKRPIIVFADSENDPMFTEQMDLLRQRMSDLEERDVVVLTDTDTARLSPVRERFRPRGFMVVILSKEGRVQLRKPFPWDVREITRTIDKMPIRQREIRESKERQ